MIAERKHYFGIDTLRVIAMIGIILGHFLGNSHYQLNGYIFEKVIPSFSEFVLLFMIVSCFSVCCGYFEKITNGKISFGEFYSRRFTRIWPFFSALCMIDVILSPSVGALYEAFANMTLFHGFLNANISVIGVGWFLGIVCIFYIAFPLFCWLLQEKWRAWLAFAAFLGLNIACEQYFNIGRNNFGNVAVFFMAGGLIYLYRERLQHISKKCSLCIFLAFSALTVIRYVVWDNSAIKLVMYSLLLVLAIGNSLRGGTRVIQFLSSLSMEIYLCHMVIFRLFEKLRLLRPFNNDLVNFIVLAAGIIAGAAVFSMILDKMIEISKKILHRVLPASAFPRTRF